MGKKTWSKKMNFKVNLFFHLTHITPLGIPIPTVPRVSDGVITWGCCFPPPFQQIIFCIFLCQPWSAKALKRLLTTRFAKMMLTPRSALKVHEPYISHEIADSHFTRAFIVIQALVSQNALHIKLICVHLLTIQVWVFTPGIARHIMIWNDNTGKDSILH